MVGSFSLAVAFIIVGVLLAALLPGAGLFVGLVVIVVGVLFLAGAFGAGRRGRARTAPKP